MFERMLSENEEITASLSRNFFVKRSGKVNLSSVDYFVSIFSAENKFVVLVVLNFLSEINDISVSLNFPWRSGAQGAKKVTINM